MAALVEGGTVFVDGLPQAIAGRTGRQHALGGGVAFQDVAVAVLHHQAIRHGAKHGGHALAGIGQGDRRLAPFRDVGNHRQRAARLAIVRLDAGARQQAPQAGQVLAEETEVDLVRLAGEAAVAGQAPLHQQLAVAVHEVEQGTAQHFLHRVAQHVRHLRIDEGGFAVRIRHPDAFGRRLHDQAVAFRTGVQRFFGALALRHVAQRDDGKHLPGHAQRRQADLGGEMRAVAAARHHHPARQAVPRLRVAHGVVGRAFRHQLFQ